MESNSELNEIEEKIVKKNIKISKHATERYVERTMDKDEKQEINLYINSHSKLLDERINKLYTYSELFYEGILRDKSYAKFYFNKDGWVLITDRAEETLVTVYKIDLHAGVELNKNFMNIMLEKINNSKEALIRATQERDKDNKQYRDNISNNESRIKDYEKLIKSLKEENENIMNYIKTNQSSVSTTEQELKENIEYLISWKVF